MELSRINNGLSRIAEILESCLSEAKGRIGKEDLKRPWTINGSQWLIIKKIHEPWAGEISPMQYARMGKGQKAAYDRKRHKEWNDAAKGKAEWRDAVYKAHQDGKFDMNDRDVHPDVKDAVRRKASSDEKEEKERLLIKAMKENEIENTSQLKVGDTVYSIMARNYADVLKVSKKSVRISSQYSPKGMKQDVKALQWLSYDDLKKKVFGE